VWDDTVSLAIKNISKAPLNVPASQLLERFVRGDESRTTEGSGLGLSIAQSLTELQGGVFRIDIDGDLFKAVVTFPEYKEPIPLPEKSEQS
ncbi:MAG: sensor histidine kinase, partial [Clostridia bacterium]|nr:sensor histidine kinase [Clostridia bacterium]